METVTCTLCGVPLPGAGLKIDSHLLCVWCGETWTLPSYGLGVSLHNIQKDRAREREREAA